MAGLKKPNRKKDNTNPNTVLVIFLVFFILLSIGLGVFAYYGYDGQEKLLADAKSSKAGEASAKKGEDFYRFLAYHYRVALGAGDGLNQDEKVDYDKLWTDYSTGAFKDQSFEKVAPTVQKVMADSKKLLGEQAGGKEYAENFKGKVEKLTVDLQTAQASLKTKEEELAAAKKQFETLLTNQDTQYKKAMAAIAAGNDKAFDAAKNRTAAMTKSIEEVVSLNKEIQDLKREKDDKIEQQNRQIELLKNKLAEAAQQKADVVSATRNPNDVHALLLDISTGKPLWDNPLGKVTRVDMARREVTINLGSDDGVKPEATFTVFGPGALGRAEGPMKATLEVARVVGPHQSLARITSLYDAKGMEIDPAETTSQRIQRESESALREGDLLHNMFWGSHVAIAGPVSLTGAVSDNPAGQMRQLDDFRYHLERMGMTVDAYLDLTDGQVKGAVTPKTRYLIRGEDPRLESPDQAKPKNGNEEAKEGEEAKDAADPKMEQAKALIDALTAMRKEATAKGMFIVSAENFLTVSGYRRPLGTVARGRSTFRPAAPAAGSAQPGIFAPPARPAANAEEKAAAPMNEEKQ